jgi:SAM-dependent methyltransferase
MGWLVPARRRGHEILDDPSVNAETRLQSINDVTRSNRIFGGLRAATSAVDSVLEAEAGALTLLDVGTGLADVPLAIAERASRGSRTLRTIGLDESVDLLGAASRRVTHAVCGSVAALPFRDRSVDIVLCSQLLHHFAGPDLDAVLAELDRVARRHVVVADLRRSWLAAAGFWAASFPLGFHPVTRHDGVVSVLRGFTAAELERAIVRSVGVTPRIERHLGFRLTASWSPVTS